MASEKSGLVTFPVNGSPRGFRFKVTASEDRLQIWIEDTTTDEQWQTSELSVADFVTEVTSIPMAVVSDYAQLIGKYLDPAGNLADSPTCSLSRPAEDGSRILCVGFDFHIMTRVVPIEYTFTLRAVEIDPLVLLQVRMKKMETKFQLDIQRQQTLIDQLTAENQTLKATSDTLQSQNQQLQASLVKAQAESKANTRWMVAVQPTRDVWSDLGRKAVNQPHRPIVKITTACIPNPRVYVDIALHAITLRDDIIGRLVFELIPDSLSKSARCSISRWIEQSCLRDAQVGLSDDGVFLDFHGTISSGEWDDESEFKGQVLQRFARKGDFVVARRGARHDDWRGDFSVCMRDVTAEWPCIGIFGHLLEGKDTLYAIEGLQKGHKNGHLYVANSGEFV